MQTLLARHSCRQFTETPLTQQEVDSLLHAAMQAPSAGNEQPWHFYVCTSAEVRHQLRQASPYAGPAEAAPCAIVVCVDKTKIKYQGNEVQDCAAASQNILLAAYDMGLGAVWLGITPEADRVERVNRILSLPETMTAFSIIAVGHPRVPQTTAPAQSRFDASRVHVVA
ncbi:putative nitroreductase family protein [Paratrimastix pyriformis]|uniref:Nitroreductase family protein n=1 Tax=Paratrimastix pyriformis TaxID=342808 RepID=A0ABQ8UWU6_9EUKA|nr:putative nitroreductase family protein [Paratrimastix pyriformis]